MVIAVTGSDGSGDALLPYPGGEDHIPIATVFTGGYSQESWRIHADAIEDIVVRFEGSG